MTIIESIRDWYTLETARNKIASIFAGFLFFAGWWILIDALAVNPGKITTGQAFIGVFGTISFFMVNSVKNSHLSEDVSPNSARAAKVWLLIGFVMGFSSIIAAAWIMVEYFTAKEAVQNWPGVAILIQNVFILIGSLVYKFGRNEEEWSY